MCNSKRTSRFFKKTFLLILGGGAAFFFFQQPEQKASSFATPEFKESITLDNDGILLTVPKSKAENIRSFCESLHISIGDDDLVVPRADTALVSGQTITIRHAKSITIKTKDETKRVTTTLLTAGEALREQGIVTDENDISLPTEETPLTHGDTIQVIRVSVEEQSIDQSIAFEKKSEEDPKLSWRKTIVKQKGVPGVRTLTYRIKKHDGKVIEKKLLKSEVATEPVTEITTQGTLVSVGKSHTGLGTWYAYTGTLAAASPWLPMGSYVRVTNQDNGKQVIVKINDRGPFGKNRILDLDKVAFQKIASLGAGVINLKVEEITN